MTDLEEIGHDQPAADTELDDDAEIQSMNDDDDDDRLESLAEEMDEWDEDEDEHEEGAEEETEEKDSEQKIDPTAADTLPYPPYDGGFSFDEEILKSKLAGDNQQPAKEAAEVVASSDEGEGNDDKADRDAHCNKEIPPIIYRGLLSYIVSCPCMTVPLLMLSTTHVVHPLPVIEAALSGQAATCSADVI